MLSRGGTWPAMWCPVAMAEVHVLRGCRVCFPFLQGFA